MQKLSEVESAKALMNEAMRWSVMKWLREKKTVRKTADQANAALDQLSEELRQTWPSGVRTAYDALASADGSQSRKTQDPSPPNGQAAVNKIRQADDEALRVRMLAEETFDRAERLLSTRLAREGCVQAIRSWELKEKAIRLTEEIGRTARN
jgi:hypothetical protein